jgi:hypothetical protein
MLVFVTKSCHTCQSLSCNCYKFIEICAYDLRNVIFFSSQLDCPNMPRPHHCWSWRLHSDAPHSVDSLGDRSARRRELYLTVHSTHKRQKSMIPAGFEPAISASERPQTPLLRPFGHRVRPVVWLLLENTSKLFCSRFSETLCFEIRVTVKCGNYQTKDRRAWWLQ